MTLLHQTRYISERCVVMRKAFNILLYMVSGVVVLAIGLVIVSNKPLPYAEPGPRAEALADSMLQAINLPAWESLRYVKFSYRNTHHYVWDRWYNLIETRFDDHRVLLALNTLQGRAWLGDEQLYEEEKREILQRAWSQWCNDSYWLNPVAKIRDEGTERQLVELDGDRHGLLVTYTEGGVTPGDSYLFVPGQNGLPAEWHIWASVLPVKGVRFTIDEWYDLNGAKVPVKHTFGPFTISIHDVLCGDHHSDLGLSYDPFTDF